MAVIGKIRKRTGLLLLVIVGGLGVFILQDAIQNYFFSTNNTRDVGEIAGQTIDRQDLSRAWDMQAILYSGPTGEQLTEQQQSTVTSKAWEKMIFNTAYAEQFEKVGIAVTREGEGNEAEDLYRGNTISSFFKNFQPYLNAEGEIDRTAMESFLQAMDNPEMLPPNQQGWIPWWAYMKEELVQTRLMEKYNTLFTKTAYVNKYEAKMNYMASNTKASFNYLYIPYTDIADSTVKYEESQLEEYYDNHIDEYKVATTRELSMVVFPIAPSTEDTNRVMDEVARVLQELPGVAEEEDTMYVYKNSSNPVDPTYKKYKELPKTIKDDSIAIAEGAIFGPAIKDGVVSVYKITDISKDTVYTANVSMIAMAKMDQQGQMLTDAALKVKEKEVKAVLDSANSGYAFDSLANKHSVDPNNFDQQTGEQKGGYIGEITNKSRQYFPQVIDAIFDANTTGVQELVETPTAYFIIKINKPSSLTSIDDVYRLVTVDKDLFASKKTIRELKTNANRLIQGADGNAEKFKLLVEETEGVNLEAPVTLTLDRVQNGEFTISPKVGKSKNMGSWAFEEAEVGGAPKFFEVEGNYVVAVLTKATNEGENNLAAVRERVERDLLNQLKYETFEERISKISGPLKDRVDEYNKQFNGNAKRERVEKHILANNYLLASPEPSVIGAVFGIGEGNRSNPIKGNSGLFIVETIKEDAAEELADYTEEALKKQRSLSYTIERILNMAIREWAEIEDNRLKSGAL